MPRPLYNHEHHPDFTDTERSIAQQAVKERYGKQEVLLLTRVPIYIACFCLALLAAK